MSKAKQTIWAADNCKYYMSVSTTASEDTLSVTISSPTQTTMQVSSKEDILSFALALIKAAT